MNVFPGARPRPRQLFDPSSVTRSSPEFPDVNVHLTPLTWIPPSVTGITEMIVFSPTFGFVGVAMIWIDENAGGALVPLSPPPQLPAPSTTITRAAAATWPNAFRSVRRRSYDIEYPREIVGVRARWSVQRLAGPTVRAYVLYGQDRPVPFPGWPTGRVFGVTRG